MNADELSLFFLLLRVGGKYSFVLLVNSIEKHISSSQYF